MNSADNDTLLETQIISCWNKINLKINSITKYRQYNNNKR